MQVNNQNMISEFAKRYSKLEAENQSLKVQLDSEVEAHATTKALLSNVLKEINSDPDRVSPGEPLMNDMKIFAEKSILFCDQMRAFASHVLQKHEQRVSSINQDRGVSPAMSCKTSSKTASPERREDSDHDLIRPNHEETQDMERDKEPETDQAGAGTPGSEAAVTWSGQDASEKPDSESRFYREQLGRFGRELERLLHDHSDRIELQSLARLYHRRYRRELPSFPNATFEEILQNLPGQDIRVETTEQGDFLILLSQHRPRFSRSNFYRQDRGDRGRRSRSRSPRSSRHTSRGRSRSHERYARSSSKHEEGSRPARSYYRFARSPEGTLVCIYFNSRTCPNKPCNYAHICGNCGKTSHGMRSCPSLQQDSANENTDAHG